MFYPLLPLIMCTIFIIHILVKIWSSSLQNLISNSQIGTRKPPSSQFHPILFNIANHPTGHLGSTILGLIIFKIWYRIRNQRSRKPLINQSTWFYSILPVIQSAILDGQFSKSDIEFATSNPINPRVDNSTRFYSLLSII